MDIKGPLIIAVITVLLTLSGTYVLDRFKNRKRKNEFLKAAGLDLKELRWKLAFSVYLAQERLGIYTPNLFPWLLSILSKYDGPEKGIKEIVEIGAKLGSTAEDTLQKYFQYAAAEKENVSIGFKKYDLSFIRQNTGFLVHLSTSTQTQIMTICQKLDMLNEDIDRYYELHNKTFDESLSKENRAIVKDNMRVSLNSISSTAHEIADLITLISQQRGFAGHIETINR